MLQFLQKTFPVLISVWLLFISISTLSAQIRGSLNTLSIVELECVETQSGTLIAASMESPDLDVFTRDRIVIHRSTDDGTSWKMVQAFEPKGEDRLADPVLAMDDYGVLYVIFMYIDGLDRLSKDLHLYSSKDDGQTWTLVGYPHKDDLIADYPQLIAKGQGILHLVYTYIKRISIYRETIFKKSVDGGQSWSVDTVLTPETPPTVGPDLCFGIDSNLILSVALGQDPTIRVFGSDTDGEDWKEMATLTNPGGVEFVVTKPVCHPSYDHYAILAHEPHIFETDIISHNYVEGNWHAHVLGRGAYAQGVIDVAGNIHVTFNRIKNDRFEILYCNSKDKGLTFTEPLILFSDQYSAYARGEYQSMFMNDNGLIYLTFCDWAENSSAKLLVFDPGTVGVKTVEKGLINFNPNPAHDRIFINHDTPNEVISIRLLDMNGRTVLTHQKENSSTQTVLNIGSVPPGNYVLSLEERGRILVSLLTVGL